MWALVGPLANALRGGQFDTEKFKWPHDIVNAIIFGATTLLATRDLATALLAAPCMWVGATPGWGAYIGALLGVKPHAEQGWIDDVIKRFEDRPFLWGMLGLTLRGWVWGACLAVAFSYSYPLATAGFILAGILMGVVYGAVAALMEKFAPQKKIFGKNAWTIGEWVFGLVLWMPLNLV